jgi:hypothetical protein
VDACTVVEVLLLVLARERACIQVVLFVVFASRRVGGGVMRGWINCGCGCGAIYDGWEMESRMSRLGKVGFVQRKSFVFLGTKSPKARRMMRCSFQGLRGKSLSRMNRRDRASSLG